MALAASLRAVRVLAGRKHPIGLRIARGEEAVKFVDWQGQPDRSKGVQFELRQEGDLGGTTIQ
jgi:hypothetical protein